MVAAPAPTLVAGEGANEGVTVKGEPKGYSVAGAAVYAGPPAGAGYLEGVAAGVGAGWHGNVCRGGKGGEYPYY